MVDAKCHTNVPGIFGAGDVTTVPYKQIIIATGEGARRRLGLRPPLSGHLLRPLERPSAE